MNPHADVSMPSLIDDLQRICAEQIVQHDRLLVSLECKAQAIRTADLEAMSAVCSEEQQIIDIIADLEKTRLRLVGSVTARLAPDAPQPMRARQIVESLDGEQRRAFAEVSERLRQSVDAVRQRSAVVRSAAESLAAHLTGVMQTFCQSALRGTVYGRRGRLDVGGAHLAVDVKS